MERGGNENDSETLCYMYSVQKFCLHMPLNKHNNFILSHELMKSKKKDSHWKSGLVKPLSLIINERGCKFNIMNYFIFSSVTFKYYVHVHNWLFCLITLNWKQWLEIKNKPDKQK